MSKYLTKWKLLFAREVEPVDLFISVFNGVLRKAIKENMWIVSQILYKVNLTNRHSEFVKTYIIVFLKFGDFFFFWFGLFFTFPAFY